MFFYMYLVCGGGRQAVRDVCWEEKCSSRFIYIFKIALVKEDSEISEGENREIKEEREEKYEDIQI